MASSRLAVSFITYPLPQASHHFLTYPTDRRLLAALALSLCLHATPLLTNLNFRQNLPSTAAPLLAELRPPPPAAATTPPLTLPEQTRPAKAEKPADKPRKIPPQPSASRPKTWTQAVTEQLRKRDAEGLFYPAEAIDQGLQGEALVLMIIDPSGKVSAARIERSSGHATLDQAALRAIRSLRSLPADAPQEAVLPVRFSLR